MNMSEHGLRLLAGWEGSRSRVYCDSAGLPTIGVGHLLTSPERSCGAIQIDGDSVHYGIGLSDDQITCLLMQDLRRFEDAVGQGVTVELEQNQFDALVAFCFNVGIGAFQKSSLLRVLNEGSFADVPDELRRWTVAGGRQVDGLVNRREREIDLWRGEI